jgi:hypothetical protein
MGRIWAYWGVATMTINPSRISQIRCKYKTYKNLLTRLLISRLKVRFLPRSPPLLPSIFAIGVWSSVSSQQDSCSHQHRLDAGE